MLAALTRLKNCARCSQLENEALPAHASQRGTPDRFSTTNARATRREIESLPRSAVIAGEFGENVGPRRLARAIEAIIGGSLMSWACYRQGPAAVWIRQNLDAVLEPHMARPPRPESSKSSRGHGLRRS